MTRMKVGFGGSVVLFCAAVLASGCNDDGGDGAESGGSGGTGGSGVSGGTGGSGTTSCTESPLFSARPYGTDGYDLIREVQVDEVSGDTYFSVMDDLFVLWAGATEPETLAVRPSNDVSYEFWVTPDSLLFPGGMTVLELPPAVLYETDRSGANPEIVIPLPEDNSLNWLYEAGKVRVIGDDVFWIARDRYTEDPSDLLPEWQFTYAVRRTSWRSPAEPIDVYTSDRYIDGMIVAAGKVFIEEEVGEVQSFDFEQRIVDLATGAVDPMTATERYGGTVIAADDDTLIVTQFDLDNPSGIGTYALSPDGSGSERFTESVFFGSVVHRDGLWVYTETPSGSQPTPVMTYRRGETPRTIGCISGRSTTNHDLWVGEDEALIAIFREQTSTILRFGL
jgi:hypothetical protein